MSTPAFTLHTFFRSTSAARLRIALGLKDIAYQPVYVNLFSREQESEDYRKLNPSGTVPLLTHHRPDAEGGDVSIGQSQAALEYLEELFASSRPLLPPPSDQKGRAYVRELMSLIVSDVQPVTSLRILISVGDFGADRTHWANEWTARGLKAYESRAKGRAGKFSYGDSITLADVCLVAASWSPSIPDFDFSAYPTVARIVNNMNKESAVQAAHWRNQGDTPEAQRA